MHPCPHMFSPWQRSSSQLGWMAVSLVVCPVAQTATRPPPTHSVAAGSTHRTHVLPQNPAWQPYSPRCSAHALAPAHCCSACSHSKPASTRRQLAGTSCCAGSQARPLPPCSASSSQLGVARPLPPKQRAAHRAERQTPRLCGLAAVPPMPPLQSSHSLCAHTGRCSPVTDHHQHIRTDQGAVKRQGEGAGRLSSTTSCNTTLLCLPGHACCVCWQPTPSPVSLALD
jgi:hypothetical protein